jgi:hypothetical protein
MPYANKEDEREYQRKHYIRYKDEYLKRSKENNRRYIRRNRELVNRYKVFVGCHKCGFKKHHNALDLHHVSGNKDRTIARLCRGSVSMKRLEEEIRKCVVLCANCHRMEHAKRSPSQGSSTGRAAG